jgi:iron complex outermembrane receptor protein
VAKPKIAAAWDIFDGLRIRGSYSEGFRAPNLEQVNATTYGRLATNNDFIRCEADLRAGRIANLAPAPARSAIRC